MKNLLRISILVMIVALLAISCSPESETLDDELSLVNFSTENGGKRSLEKTSPTFNKDSYYWYYTAVKDDETGLVTGEKKSETAVNEGSKGLSSVGPFSYGDWVFTLYAYGEKDGGNNTKVVDKDKLVFKGSSKVTIKDKTTTIKVTVSAQMTGKDGYLELQGKGEITITKGSTDDIDPDYTKLVEKISILSLDTDNTVAKDFYEITATNADEGITVTTETVDSVVTTTRRFTLTSGSYAVTVSYLEGAVKSTDGTYKGGYAVAEETIYVTIYDYLATAIGGNITESTGDASFDVESDGVYTSAKVEALTKSTSATTNAEKTITVKASPSAKATKSDDDTVTLSDEQETVVTIDEGAISDVDGTGSAVLSVTAYDAKAAASTIPTFTVSDKTNSTIGALDITLTVKKTSGSTAEQVKTFENGKKLTFTTYIAKGLTKENISVVYSGETIDGLDESKKDGTVTEYDADTGKLVFEVYHLSNYYIVSPDVLVYNPSSQKAYAAVSSAITEATSGDTLVLWQDAAFDKQCTIFNDITIDLNSHSLDMTNSSINIMGSFGASGPAVVIKNGTIKGAADADNLAGQYFYLMGGSLTLENVSSSADDFSGYNCFNLMSGKFTLNNSNMSFKGKIGIQASSYSNVDIEDSSIYVSNGTEEATALKLTLHPVVNVSGSVISGYTYAGYLEGATLTAENSTFEASASSGESTVALYVVDNSSGSDAGMADSTVTLTNVTLETGADTLYGLYASKKNSGTVKVSGSLSKDSSLVMNSDFNGAEVSLEKYVDSFEGLKAAVNLDAVKTITLLNDITLSGEITLDKDVTLNLNDKTITASEGCYLVVGDGILTVKNSGQALNSFVKDVASDEGKNGIVVNPKTVQKAINSVDSGEIYFVAGEYDSLEFSHNKVVSTAKKSGGDDVDIDTLTESTAGVYWYCRDIKGLKLIGGEGVVFSGSVKCSSGHIYGTETAPITDPVRGTTTNSTNDSYHSSIVIDGLTISGFTFDGGQLHFASGDTATIGERKATYSNVTVKDCSFNGNKNTYKEKGGLQAIRFQTDNEKLFNNLTFSGNTIKKYYQGIYVKCGNGVTIDGNTISETIHNAIQVMGLEYNNNKSVSYVYGDIKITGNNISDTGDRAIRFAYGNGANFVVSGNAFTGTINSGDKATASGGVYDLLKGDYMVNNVTTTFENNTYTGYTLTSRTVEETKSIIGTSTSTTKWTVEISSQQQ